MKKPDRLLCVGASFVPAICVWLSLQRHLRFHHLMGNFMGRPYYEWATPVTDFVFKTISFWPYIVYFGWLLLIPAMLGKPWCRKLRLGLTIGYLVVGPVLYGICPEGLYHSEMMVLETWGRADEEIEKLVKMNRQRSGEDDATVQQSKAMEDELIKKGRLPVEK